VESMNRETKRRLQRQGQMDAEGAPARTRQPTPRPAPRQTPGGGGLVKRTTRFLGEVRGELRKVAWPTRDEVQNYSMVVFISLVVIIALIFVLDYSFAKGVILLFKT
jgi:preprotein translocase subunit SecE